MVGICLFQNVSEVEVIVKCLFQSCFSEGGYLFVFILKELCIQITVYYKSSLCILDLSILPDTYSGNALSPACGSLHLLYCVILLILTMLTLMDIEFLP